MQPGSGHGAGEQARAGHPRAVNADAHQFSPGKLDSHVHSRNRRGPRVGDVMDHEIGDPTAAFRFRKDI
ncbi:MAG TPA: hypothetical protein VIJ94_03555, partial [Caulobacteraceae bacterium]